VECNVKKGGEWRVSPVSDVSDKFHLAEEVVAEVKPISIDTMLQQAGM